MLYALAAEQLDAAGFALDAGTTQPRVQLHALTCTPVSRGNMIDMTGPWGFPLTRSRMTWLGYGGAAVPRLARSLHILTAEMFS